MSAQKIDAKGRPFFHPNWRDHVTDDDRDLTNRWMRGIDWCVSKVGRKWNSGVPKAPLFKTKREAYEFVTRYVCDAIPIRCSILAEAEEAAR